jgi:hypothetical protein
VSLAKKISGVTIDRSVIQSAASILRTAQDAGEVEPTFVVEKRGGNSSYPFEGEKNLYREIVGLRERNVAVFKCLVFKLAFEQIQGTPYEANFPSKTMTEAWYKKFKSEYCLKSKNYRTLEFSRARWCTVPNLLDFFENAERILLDLGFVVPNPSFVEAGAEGSAGEKVIWTEKGRSSVASLDETHVGGQEIKKGGNTRTESTLVLHDHDDGSAAIPTGDNTIATIVGGSFVDGNSIRPYVVFKASAFTPTLNAAMLLGPSSTKVDASTNEPVSNL